MRNKFMLFTAFMMVFTTLMTCQGNIIIGIVSMIFTYFLSFLGIVNSLINIIEMSSGRVPKGTGEL